MMNRRSELRQKDLVNDEPLDCIQCTALMVFDKKLNNGRTKEGFYRRIRYKCDCCGHTEIIYANGKRDMNEHLVSVEKSREELQNDLSEMRDQKIFGE